MIVKLLLSISFFIISINILFTRSSLPYSYSHVRKTRSVYQKEMNEYDSEGIYLSKPIVDSVALQKSDLEDLGSGEADLTPLETTSTTHQKSTTQPFLSVGITTLSPSKYFSHTTKNYVSLPNEFQPYDYIDTYIIRENCAEYRHFGFLRSGIYRMKIPRFGEFFALCFMENDGAWTVLQKRSSSIAIPFWNRTFEEYANGFGSVSSDHWLGLDRVSAYIKRGYQLELRVALRHDLCDENGKCSKLGADGFWWADWNFKISDKKQKYKLSVSSVLHGNLTDPVKDPLLWLNNDQPFTTIDSDNDKHLGVNCAEYRKFGGWWHKDCTLVALNGDDGVRMAKAHGMHWTYQTISSKGKNKNTIVSYVIKPKFSLMMFRFK